MTTPASDPNGAWPPDQATGPEPRPPFTPQALDVGPIECNGPLVSNVTVLLYGALVVVGAWRAAGLMSRSRCLVRFAFGRARVGGEG